MLLHLDIETKSRLNIKNVGQDAYAKHPSTDVWCVCWRPDGDYGDVSYWTPGLPVPPLLASGEYILGAHNYRFEQAILNNILAPRYGFGQPRGYHCTMALAMRYNLPPSLEDLAIRLGITDLKDSDGKALMVKMSNRKTYNPLKKGSMAQKRFADDFRRLIAYCQQDVRAEQGCSDYFAQAGLTYDEAEFQLDKTINDRGIKVDIETAKAIQRAIAKEQEDLEHNLAIKTLGAVTTGRQQAKLLEWLQALGYPADNLRANVVDEVLASPGGMSTLGIEVLELRKKLALGSLAKFNVMERNADAQTDRLHGMFQLYGASQTGRWGGRMVQPQNLPRMSITDEQIAELVTLFRNDQYDTIKAKYGDLHAIAKQMIRPMFTSDEGLVVSDLSQIECRTVAWLADCEPLCELFTDSSRDPYSEMASSIYGHPASNYGKGTDGRQLGKCAVLGCGFGLGRNGFKANVKNMVGMVITEDLADHVVSTYRGTFPQIPNYWRRLENAFRGALDQRFFGEARVGQLLLQGQRNRTGGVDIRIVLPSGRTLNYPNSRDEPHFGLTFTDSKNRPSRLYGGRLCENVTQAVARDVLIHGMFQLEFAGFPVVGHVHDEVILDKKASDIDLQNIDRIMSTGPAWADGLPLAAETGRCSRYTK